MRNAPRLTGLRAFEAVLRHGSLSGAGRELCVTPAAISHRLRDLEAEAGVPLVYRSGGRFLPTEAGAAIAAIIGDAFGRLTAAHAALSAVGRSSEVRIVAPMSFSVLWLIPRLGAFERAHPDVTPYIAAVADPARREGETPHLRIVHAERRPEGEGWELLVRDRTVVAAAPGHPALGTSSLVALQDMRAVHIESPGGRRSGTLTWPDWIAATGQPMAVPRGPRVSAEHVAADIASRGDAIMLASLFTLSADLASGRLAVVPGSLADVGIGYWMALERHTATAAAFRDWLRSEIGEGDAGRAASHAGVISDRA